MRLKGGISQLICVFRIWINRDKNEERSERRWGERPTRQKQTWEEMREIGKPLMLF